MISTQYIVFIAIAYLVILFAIAYAGDLQRSQSHRFLNPNVVYALSLAVYCSSWTFYGAAGTAAVTGLDYLAIYVGPCFVFMFGYPIMRRIIMVCKQNNITSISDFISSRYGKSRRIGVLVTIIAVVGSLPYIALQLKAVSMSFLVLNQHAEPPKVSTVLLSADTVAFYTSIILAIFAILFGTRHLDATEHHRGMVLAISFESIIKLIAILVVGFYSSYLLIGHPIELNNLYSRSINHVFASSSSTWVSFLTKTFLSMGAIILLPRQFQMSVVESNGPEQFKTAAWIMPMYLLLTSIIVIPIALAGSLLLPEGDTDLYVLTLPLSSGSEMIGILSFIGGLSAATGMVIVAVISLSTMICNDLVMPNLIRLKSLDILNRNGLDSIILSIRRLAIIVLLAVAYGYYKLLDSNAQLANIGLVSFAAVIQFAPAILFALFWRRAHSKGIYWGLVAGFILWAYTLMLPTILSAEVVSRVWPVGSWTNPQSLFGMTLNNPLTHGVIWSLFANLFFLILFSLRNQQAVLEKIQASRFFHTGVVGLRVRQLDGDKTILVHPDSLRILAERIIGIQNTKSVFQQYEEKNDIDLQQVTQIDRRLLSSIQTAIAGVIGSASAQKVISDVIMDNEDYLDEVTTLVDETSSVLQFNRRLLQTALQNITHGISVVDEDLNLVVWNQRYVDLFNYPENFIYVGKPIREVLDYNAQRGYFDNANQDIAIRKRLKYLQNKTPYTNIKHRPNGLVIKSVGEPMPNGGFVTTYEDITESVQAAEMLKKANEELEYRVLVRTRELEELTNELEQTTRSKTHFLAAASHDLLQPINAARLFAHSVLERSEDNKDIADLAKKIDQSLVTANQLLRALLDISKLDSGGMQPTYSTFNLKEFVDEIITEFKPMAEGDNVEISATISESYISSDRQLLLSVLQNFITNAIRYSAPNGTVNIHFGSDSTVQNSAKDDLVPLVKLCVSDTGKGINKDQLELIFNEFYQIKTDSQRNSQGLGLGLSIVKRIGRLLNLKVEVDSVLGEGSTFSIYLPEVDKPTNKTTVKAAISTTKNLHKLQGLKVLCLDNDESVLVAMQTLLTGWGCSVDCITSYKEAVVALQEKRYQLVLADYRLDFEETGLDFLNYVIDNNNLDDTLNTQGVLITAEQDESLQVKAKEIGCQYLPKPIEPAALKSLMNYLSGK